MLLYAQDGYDEAFEDDEWFFEEDPYEEIREILAPEYADLAPEDIEEIIWETLGDVSPEEFEGLLSTLGSIGRSVGGAVSRVLPTALPVIGTAVGTALGGPMGGALGSVAGQALGSVAGQALGSTPRPAQPITQPRPVPSGPGVPRPQTPAMPMGGGSPATAQLLQTMLNPQVLQALLSMLLGQAGQQQVRVGGTPVPPAAFANLLGVLANRAAAEYNALVTPSGEDIPRYLLDANGEFVVDPAVPEERAAALLALLEQADWEEPAYDVWEDDWVTYQEIQDALEAIDEEFYDALDFTQVYADMALDAWED